MSGALKITNPDSALETQTIRHFKATSLYRDTEKDRGSLSAPSLFYLSYISGRFVPQSLIFYPEEKGRKFLRNVGT
jgi:hypothetical protein